MGPEDSNAIVTFLSTNNFPFHVRREWTEVELTGVVDGGRYWNNESQGFWIIGDGECLGMAVLEDLEDDTPMFDLRLAGTYRGLGLGVLVLKELTDKVLMTTLRLCDSRAKPEKTILRCVKLSLKQVSSRRPTTG